ncbi:cytochrome P450 [Zobellella taiwanensis]|uniref:Cytochrome P450 n=1 Tax=Zobellella taiwanensis TaxID=347535 RepID=A0A2P7QXP0_9GAMM|nr:cytochrome P450 [Zobellella taiwanensis]PSJ42731.1 cytochrome P450 [Zobellella taiwanensis]
MRDRVHADWDPRDESVQQDQIAAYDDLRRRCPVAHSDYLHWSVLSHSEVRRILEDHSTFSSAVSRHLSVPNGMDPPEHGDYRRIIEPYFSAANMRDFEPRCREIARELARELATEVELIGAFAQLFSLRVQCAFMGWPASLHEPLRQWTLKNHRATLAGDRAELAAVATEFDGYIRQLLDERRAQGEAAPDDATSRLLRERVRGRALTDEELVSLLRNWTVGELGTITASVGILAHYLAEHGELQRRLRLEPALLPAAIDEILRIHGPLISNRRITTREVDIGGRRLAAGERVSIIWASANRDEAVFGDPDAFRLDRDPADNLLYGAGIHVCPGAPLARLELRLVMEALLAATEQWSLLPGRTPLRARYPGSGFSELWLAVTPAR